MKKQIFITSPNGSLRYGDIVNCGYASISFSKNSIRNIIPPNIQELYECIGMEVNNDCIMQNNTKFSLKANSNAIVSSIEPCSLSKDRKLKLKNLMFH